jgi:hypothetical protein
VNEEAIARARDDDDDDDIIIIKSPLCMQLRDMGEFKYVVFIFNVSTKGND